ncbi:sterol 24-C-methyltransferase [Trametopsis cervina]|nr:sterol 24-C-methyltransferase [Trametopsis cervina]
MLVSSALFLPAFLAKQCASEPSRRADLHFCRLFPGDDLATSLSRHEHYLCLKLRLRPGERVLVVGCGTGDVAFELVHYANVDVVAIDADPAKIQQATRRAQRANLAHRVQFLTAGLDEMSTAFEPESFDCIYAIEAFRFAPTFESTYHQLRTLLKPGGRTAYTDWLFTPHLTPSPSHTLLASTLQRTTHLAPRPPSQRTAPAAIAALHAAGLVVECVEDLAGRRLRGEEGWWTPLERALGGESEGGVEAFGLEREGAIVVVEAAKRKLFTPMALFVASKPLAAKNEAQ